MSRVVELLRSLGTAGAVANAGSLVAARRREDWLVGSLARRVAVPAPAPGRAAGGVEAAARRPA